MPTAFDPELYLRLAGERSVLDPPPPGQPPWESSVLEIATALVGIGVLNAETAEDVAFDYQLAIDMRGTGNAGHPGLFRWPRPTASAPLVLSAPRVVACEQDLDQPWGRLHVHYVALGDHSTSLAITAVESTPGALMRGIPMPPGLALHQTPITDDQGATEVADFSGGGTAGVGWQGHLTTQAPLSRVTRWIDIGSQRLELGTEQRDPPPVRIEALSTTDPAERFLWLRLATAGHLPTAMAQTEATIETLIAASALASDAPVIDDVLAVVAAFSGQGSSGASPALPALWGRLLPRLNAPTVPAPSGTVPVGAATPPVDGVVIVIEGLTVIEQGFSVHVVTSPGISTGILAFHQIANGPRIAWWAEDDRGNSYLGGTGGWGNSTDHSEGTINYWPSLDPAATELRLMPTGLTERAVVTVTPLPGAMGR